jgi:hypothetical protein
MTTHAAQQLAEKVKKDVIPSVGRDLHFAKMRGKCRFLAPTKSGLGMTTKSVFPQTLKPDLRRRLLAAEEKECASRRG